MHIVAHEDDDILFMNPDVHNTVRSGAPVSTVFLTAGESDLPDANGYAASRQAGSRAAYALMAGVPDEWRAEPLTVAGSQVELYTLEARPQLQLIFVNLPEDNDPNAEGGKGALTRLWRDRGDRLRLRTLTPTGGVQQLTHYSRRDVIGLLVGLFQHFRPTLVRTQDSKPDARYVSGWKPFRDHPDHVMTARFTSEAIRVHRTGGGNPRLVQADYRNYNIEEAPVNLAAGQRQEKADVFAAYGRHDPLVSHTGSYAAWPQRMYYRWPLGTTWVARDGRDRLQAFLVQAGELLTWWQEPDGGWTGPASLGDAGGMLAPSVSVARNADGRLQVVAHRLDDGQIVTVAQGVAGDPRSWPEQWQRLGNPNPPAQAQLGAPILAVGAGGRLVAFVRNSAGGVSSCGQQTAGGAWQPGWARLGGTDVQDGLAAVTTGDGRIELFGANRHKLLRWHQPTPDAPLALDGNFPGEAPASPPVMAGGGDVPVRIMYKQAGTADVAGIEQRHDGHWAPLTPVGPTPTGAGGLTALANGGNVLVWARNAAGAVIMTSTGTATWSDLGGTDLVDQPVAVRDSENRVVLLGAGSDGRLMVNQQSGGSADGLPTFDGWRPAGS
jgi:LmbE family N-acetylglucosaminyl deacetylase